MDGRCLIRGALAGMVLGALVYQPDVLAQDDVQEPLIEETPAVTHVHEEPGHIHDLINSVRGYVDPENAEVLSMHQLACLIDDLEDRLQYRGRMVVKGPDVWGQNRMTQYRGEYEDQMKTQLANFEIILSSYQRRADLAALTSATSVGASLAPQVSRSRNVSTTTNVTQPAIPSAASLVGPNGLVANANSLIGTTSPLLSPKDLTTLALSNKGAASGLGVEPTVLLDERSRFINYLHQLRRINTGDDRSDLPGYSLYLLRLPVSILPGDQSIRGKGATVTVKAKHDLTPDLLENTFRQVVILDTAYQLMDAVTRGQYLGLGDDPDCGCETNPLEGITMNLPQTCLPKPNGAAAAQAPVPAQKRPKPQAEPKSFQALAPPSKAGLTSPVQGSAPSTEVVAMYGPANLNKLVCAVKQDQEAWYRHDPSIVSWLISELSSAHSFMREQARNGNPMFQPAVFESMGNLALIRDYKALAFHRDKWLTELAKARHDYFPDPSKPRIRPVDILSFAIMVQSVLVDRALKHDMQIMTQRKNCSIGDPYQYTFHALVPDPSAQQAFNSYVACKWPIHVFSLDPMVDQQNQLDLFSQRTELQLALAAAIASGQVSFQNATTYARRLEQDLAAVNLNRTAVGFGAGETTFGWQFRPRIQTPPTVSNPRRIAGILLYNGPGPDFALKNLQIEPGPRECYALMVVPNFVPMIKLTTIANWFDLKTCHPEQRLEATDMIRLSRKYQTASNAMQRLCDSGRYRPVDLELLGDRLSQLESLLPMQSHQVQLPYEADLSGSEIFSSTNAALSPSLLTWYGEAARPGGSIFILGKGFNVRDMKVIIGGVTVKDAATAAAPAPGGTPSPSFDLISRNVLRVDIPQTAVPVRTPVIYRDPSVHCYKSGDCMTCAGTATGTAPPAAGGKSSPQTSGQDAGASDQSDTNKPKDPKASDCECKQRWVLDVHVATSNGISNHLLVEVAAPSATDPTAAKAITTTVTTTSKSNVADNSTTTSTQLQTTPPGIVLPPGTILPMGGSLPAGGTFVAPGAATLQGNPPGFLPGTVPNTEYPKPKTPGTPGSSSSIDLGPVDPVATGGPAASGNAAGAMTLGTTPGAGNAQEAPPVFPGTVPAGPKPADATRKGASLDIAPGGRVAGISSKPAVVSAPGGPVTTNSQPVLFIPAPVFPAGSGQVARPSTVPAEARGSAASAEGPPVRAGGLASPSNVPVSGRLDPGTMQASMADGGGARPVDAPPQPARRRTILSRILGESR